MRPATSEYPYSGSSFANPDAVTQVLLTTGQSAPTIAFDNSGLGGNGTPASSLTFSYTTNSNTNGLIIVSVDEATTSPSCTSDKVTGVTNNGASLTDLGYYAKDTNGLAVKTYYGFAPATSTHNIVVSASASCIRYAAAATYTGVKQSGMPDASGSGNPLSSSGSVSLFQATTTANYNAWAVLIGVPSTAGTATAGVGTTIRQQQSGEIYYADSGGPVFGPTGLSWTKGATADWAANYFSLAPLTSNPGVTATTSLQYDNDGNVIQVGTTTFYTYDYQNRLTQSAIWNGTATTSTSYAYGPFGERVSQTTASSTTIYPNKFYSVITTTSNGTTTATSTDYVYAGSNLFATIDQKIVNGTATGTPITRYNHTDNLGSTNVTSDSAMNVAQFIDYAPYGSVIATTNTGQATAGRQFEGLFTDASNLVYSNARYLNPAQGQFITQDPTFWGKQNIGDPQSLNTYSYASNNPIIKNDPQGLAALLFGIGATMPGWGLTGGAGIAIDLHGIDYYYSVGLAGGVQASVLQITTADLDHQYSITNSAFVTGGALVGVELSKGMTYYPFSDRKPSPFQEGSFGIRGGLGGGVMSQVSGPLVTWGPSLSNYISSTNQLPTSQWAAGFPTSGAPQLFTTPSGAIVNAAGGVVSAPHTASGGGGGGGGSGGQLFTTPSGAIVNAATGALVQGPPPNWSH